MGEFPLLRSRASSPIRIYCCAYSRIVVRKHQGFRLSGELNSPFLPGSAVQERVLPSRIKWRRTSTVRSTALSRFHPRPPPRPLPMDHGYAVGRGPFVIYREYEFARYATTAPQGCIGRRRTMEFAPRLRGETIVECTPV